MTCRGCQERRSRLKSWLREKLGIPEILTNQGRYYQEQVDILEGRVDKLVELHNQDVESIKTLGSAHIRLVRAAGELEAKIEMNDTATASLLSSSTAELAKRQDDLNATLRDLRMSGKQVRNTIADLDTEVSGLAERLQRLELPGSEPLG